MIVDEQALALLPFGPMWPLSFGTVILWSYVPLILGPYYPLVQFITWCRGPIYHVAVAGVAAVLHHDLAFSYCATQLCDLSACMQHAVAQGG